MILNIPLLLFAISIALLVASMVMAGKFLFGGEKIHLKFFRFLIQKTYRIKVKIPEFVFKSSSLHHTTSLQATYILLDGKNADALVFHNFFINDEVLELIKLASECEESKFKTRFLLPKEKKKIMLEVL